MGRKNNLKESEDGDVNAISDDTQQPSVIFLRMAVVFCLEMDIMNIYRLFGDLEDIVC